MKSCNIRQWIESYWLTIMTAALGLCLIVLRACRFTNWDWISISIVSVGFISIALLMYASIKKQKKIEQLANKIGKVAEELESLGFSVVENPEWMYVLLDSEKKIVFGIRHDGSVEWGLDMLRQMNEQLEALKKRIAELEKKEPNAPGTSGTSPEEPEA